MNKSTKTLAFGLVAFAIGIFMLGSNTVFAASDSSISLVKTSDTLYNVYVKDLNDSFKYAISDSDTIEPTDYEISSLDSSDNNVAIIDVSVLSGAEKYLWIKNGENQSVAKEFDLNDYIDFDDVTKINKLTKRIPVTNDEQEETVTDSENKTKTVITGLTKINDDDTKNYEYSLVKLPASDKINNLVGLFEKISSFNEETDMYTATTTYKEFLNIYNQVIDEVTFENVENMEIKQPEDSVTDDKYVLFLRKLDENDVIDDDMQLLTSIRKEDNGTNEIVTQKEVEKNVKLPITGDNLLLLAGFSALVIALIVLLVIKKRASKKNFQN